MQPEPEAQGLALASELFITGTLNTFAQRTNVDTNARIIDYDIRELGEQAHAAGNAGDTGRHLQPGDPQLEKRQNNVDFLR